MRRGVIWAGLGHFYAYRAARVKRRTMVRYLKASNMDRSTRQYLRNVRRYDWLKKTSEKFFSRVKGRV